MTSLSRQSSCSSLPNHNIPTTSHAHVPLPGVSPASEPDNERRKPFDSNQKLSDERTSFHRMRERNPDSDSDTLDDDSNSSSDLLSTRMRTCGPSSENFWRTPLDGMTCSGDGGRKSSLSASIFRTTTPSPSTSGRSSPATNIARPVPPRSRVANIRRESNCLLESEAAHEKLVKTAQQVSIGFDEFSIQGERKRAQSLSEPISILTNAFLPQSCSPSPTRAVDTQKQCYSPSTQQVVRNNITYSPSPSPTPSPTRRIMRSLSPIAVRQVTKRRYTASGLSNGVESDGETSSTMSNPAKRYRPTSSSALPNGPASPLASDRVMSSYGFISMDSVSSNSPMSSFQMNPSLCPPCPPFRMLLDPAIERQRLPPLSSPMDSDDCNSFVGDDDVTSDPLLPQSPLIPAKESEVPAESVSPSSLTDSSALTAVVTEISAENSHADNSMNCFPPNTGTAIAELK
ncbi:hypothetical protein AB6A40_005697 [Gnathostoma spinigerum]|uniref:Uncharacterized protein n=1 Tax=Gnathostoma spinigerum TaxID=75299 RepID=A0ABD6EPR1_9BILA